MVSKEDAYREILDQLEKLIPILRLAHISWRQYPKQKLTTVTLQLRSNLKATLDLLPDLIRAADIETKTRLDDLTQRLEELKMVLGQAGAAQVITTPTELLAAVRRALLSIIAQMSKEVPNLQKHKIASSLARDERQAA